MKTANHLYLPIFSDKKYIDIIVANIGAAKEILTTVAKGRFLRAINMDTIAIKPAMHLAKCSLGRSVL